MIGFISQFVLNVFLTENTSWLLYTDLETNSKIVTRFDWRKKPVYGLDFGYSILLLLCLLCVCAFDFLGLSLLCPY